MIEYLGTLTRREREVFDLIGTGIRNSDIAERMGISLLTVRHYTKMIHDKLYIVGRARLAIESYKVFLGGGEKNGVSKRVR